MKFRIMFRRWNLRIMHLCYLCLFMLIPMLTYVGRNEIGPVSVSRVSLINQDFQLA